MSKSKFNGNAVAVREVGQPDRFAYEDDAGDIDFGPLGPRTFLFEPGEEALYSHMSACPGGHEAVEEISVGLLIQEL